MATFTLNKPCCSSISAIFELLTPNNNHFSFMVSRNFEGSNMFTNGDQTDLTGIKINHPKHYYKFQMHLRELETCFIDMNGNRRYLKRICNQSTSLIIKKTHPDCLKECAFAIYSFFGLAYICWFKICFLSIFLELTKLNIKLEKMHGMMFFDDCGILKTINKKKKRSLREHKMYGMGLLFFMQNMAY